MDVMTVQPYLIQTHARPMNKVTTRTEFHDCGTPMLGKCDTADPRVSDDTIKPN